MYYLYLRDLCVIVRYYAKRACIFWSHIYAAYIEHKAKPFNTVASYIKLVALQFRELGNQESLPKMALLVAGSNAEEKRHRERRVWTNISCLAPS